MRSEMKGVCASCFFVLVCEPPRSKIDLRPRGQGRGLHGWNHLKGHWGLLPTTFFYIPAASRDRESFGPSERITINKAGIPFHKEKNKLMD